MKKVICSIFIILLLACTKTENNKNSITTTQKTAKVSSQQFDKIDNFTKLKTYFIKDNKIYFILDRDTNKNTFSKNLEKNTSIKDVYIIGSFNSWKDDQNWKMNKIPNKDFWWLEKSLDNISIPGNSGQPEFAYYLEGTYVKNDKQRPTEGYIKPPKELEQGYKFSDQWTGHYNYIVLLPNDNKDEVSKNNLTAITIKEEFNSDEELANFRNVASGNIKENLLFRSYHPFVRNRPKSNIEEKRQMTVRSLILKNNINFIINLTDDANIVNHKNIPEFYKNKIINNQVGFAKTKYNTVYFHSDSKDFDEAMKKIFGFILEKEPPYLVHCALGSDRTGVTISVIEGLMGSTWKEIKEDYIKTNNTGMGEYRNEKLLKYSLENMLKIKIISDDQKIENEIREMFKTRFEFDEEEITKIYNKFKK